MNGEERKIAVVVLALIGLGALAIHFGKPRSGNPGLALEKGVLTNEFGEIVREERVRFPKTVPDFHSREAPITSVEATNLPPDTTFGRRIYWQDDGFAAQLSAVMMKTDRTSIHRPQVCITGQGWKIEKTEIIDIPVPLPSPYLLKATCITSSKMARDPKTEKESPRASVYVYWFVSENKTVPAHTEALWSISRDLIISGTLYPWAYVSCFVPCAPGQEGIAVARIKRLVSETVPEFQLFPARAKQTASLPKAVSLQ
jgi:hypothetical protein